MFPLVHTGRASAGARTSFGERILGKAKQLTGGGEQMAVLLKGNGPIALCRSLRFTPVPLL